MNNYEIINSLMVYELELSDDAEDRVIIITNIENIDILEREITNFKKELFADDEELEDYPYTLEEFEDYIRDKGYFLYKPEATESIYF